MAGIRQDEVHPLSRDGWSGLAFDLAGYIILLSQYIPLSVVSVDQFERAENITVTGSFATTIASDEDPYSSFILGGGKEISNLRYSWVMFVRLSAIWYDLLTSESPSLLPFQG
jgi:hypothetical protein